MTVAPPEPESLSVEGPSPFTGESFRPVPLHDIPARRSRWWWIVGLVLVLLVVGLSLLAWWRYPSIVRWLNQRVSVASPPTATATSTQQIVEDDLPTATRTSAVTAAATSTITAGSTRTTPTLELTLTPTWTPSPSPTSSPPVYTGIFLELVFTDTSWVQVTVDGVREFQGELEKDTYRSWYGEERIELRVGNAGAVLVTINGQSLGTLGAAGDVVDRVFEKVGEEVTEATVTPAPTTDLTAQPPTASPTTTRAPTSTVAPTEPISPTVTITPTSGP